MVIVRGVNLSLPPSKKLRVISTLPWALGALLDPETMMISALLRGRDLSIWHTLLGLAPLRKNTLSFVVGTVLVISLGLRVELLTLTMRVVEHRLVWGGATPLLRMLCLKVPMLVRGLLTVVPNLGAGVREEPCS